MTKLKFEKHRYGSELLFDSTDMADFKLEIQSAETDFYALALLEEVSGWLRINDQAFQLNKPALLIVSPGALVNIEDLQVQKGIWLFFDGSFLDQFFQDQFFTFRFNFFHGPHALKPLTLSPEDLRSLAPQMQDIHGEKGRFGVDSEHFVRSSLYLLLIKIHRLYAKDNPIAHKWLDDPRILRFKMLLFKHTTRPQKVEEYAKSLGISRISLNKLCQEHFAKSAKELIDDRRFLEIKGAIQYGNKELAQIAYDYGFQDLANFNRFFKRMAHCSPTEYRRNLSKWQISILLDK